MQKLQMVSQRSLTLSTTMEHLFSPCSSLIRYLENGDFHEDDWRLYELPRELNLDVSTEELLSAERGFTYADLYAMLGDEDTVAWMAPDVIIMRADGTAEHFSENILEEGEGYCHYHFIADGKEVVATARSSDSSQICDVVLRLLAVSGVGSISIKEYANTEVLNNAASLANLMEECQSLKLLSFALTESSLNSDHCRVLGAYSRPDLEIVLSHCKFTSAGASALVEILGRNQGPTKFFFAKLTIPFSRMGCAETVV
jgi:hypothetical protein